jgi:hypothetical protein
MIRRFGLILLVLALSNPGAAQDDEQENQAATAPWQLSRTFVKRPYKSQESTGVAVYTTTPDALGAAFRCQEGRLYAFVVVKPLDLHEAMEQLGWQAKRWRVTVTIGDSEPRDEVWASVHGGKILMARKRSTSRKLFVAARSGVTIVIDPKYGKDVVVDIPADTTGAFRRFEEVCGFVEAQAEGAVIAT